MPFGVNVLWDPMSSIALAAATGASFIREILTGTYASDMGPWNPDAGAAMRYRDRLGRRDLAMFDNISAEFAWSLDQRSLPDRARSAVFSSIPDAILVSGIITGEAAAMSELEAVKKVLPDTPVLANTGVKHATVADVLRVADGCIVGTVAEGRRQHLERRRSGARQGIHAPGARGAGALTMARATKGAQERLKAWLTALMADPRASAAMKVRVRRLLAKQLKELGIASHSDRMGNLIATLAGRQGAALASCCSRTWTSSA